MNESDMVKLFYLRQMRNAATGRTETSAQVAEGVRQDIATAHRSLESTTPNGAIEQALKDYPAGTGRVKTIAGNSV
ncbi:MAG: hypothetical protein Q9M16_10480 [Mariprofundus sp.]|nr:hypothetical protein [Mariprofundus sp.]